MRTTVRVFASGAVTALFALCVAATAGGGDGRSSNPNTVSHVLLISVDGLHEYDLVQWIGEHPDSNLAALARAGTQYANASAAKPSDSFPGLLAPLTGGTPKSTGVFYDDSYSRTMFAPGSDCA